MRRKREPVAEIGAEDYRIVRHTHDVDLATKLMRARLDEEYGPPEFGPREVGTPWQAWIRIVPCLPNSYGAGEGWKFEYRHAKPHARGAFRAVVFS